MRTHPLRRSRLVPPLVLFSVCAAAPTAAQGRTDYFNVESPQVKPITVARVGGHDWLLVCNTPDNSVEIWDTTEPVSLEHRVRVGLEPVSVKFNPANNRVYTADFLGDSVTSFVLLMDGETISYRPVETQYVGDEPMDIAFSADGQSLFVTLNTDSAFGWRSAATLEPVAQVGLLPDMGRVHLTNHDNFAMATKAIKEPRAALVNDGKLFVLGGRGGASTAYDFDLYSRDLQLQTLGQLGGLGTTHFNMVFASNDDLWVVGAEAQHLDNITEPEVAAEPTGFVKSTIYRVQGAGTSTPSISRRDLNDKNGSEDPVDADLALVQPTDVVAFEPGGDVYKVYFTAFGSDRIGVLDMSAPIPANPYLWPLARIDLPEFSGPRGLAVKYAHGGTDARVYVLNRLDNSFTIIDPATDLPIATQALFDPTPDYIREGREFLYSASFSGNGFVSCAVCHIDGRTDGLAWKLGTPADQPPPYPPGLVDGEPYPATGEFAPDKGSMVTQSLQGLLNFEVEPEVTRFFTNAPYHWRGDKADLSEFNGAFVNLMRRPDLDPDPEVEQGLLTAEMDAFVEFVNSIHYPPNPREPLERVYSGDGFDAPFGPSEAQHGLLLYHERPISQGDDRSCAQCHALSEGSNNRATEKAGSADPIEVAALRGLFQREAKLEPEPGPISMVVSGNFGLIHNGLAPSINEFMTRFNPDTTDKELTDLTRLVHEFDWGVAPLVGRSLTVTSSTIGTATNSTLDLFEGQAALANVGVAVHAYLGGAHAGYWLDLTVSPPAYRLEGGTATLSRDALLDLVVSSRDRLVFIATPLGSERRVASVTGASADLPYSLPTDIVLLPTRTNTANVAIPTLRGNWDPFPTGTPLPAAFVWPSVTIPEPSFLKSIRILQKGLVLDGDYGIGETRHEAPRRFVIAGNGIQPGAVLELHVPDSSVAPNPAGPLGQIATILLRLPLHPTDETWEGRRVWQTAVEIEPLHLYTFMLGGPLAHNVATVVDPISVAGVNEQLLTSGFFQPDVANWHYVRVVNPGIAAVGDGGWQQLKVD
jgi:DNA-binding beta-propeller fold protein YncE